MADRALELVRKQLAHDHDQADEPFGELDLDELNDIYAKHSPAELEEMSGGKISKAEIESLRRKAREESDAYKAGHAEGTRTARRSSRRPSGGAGTRPRRRRPSTLRSQAADLAQPVRDQAGAGFHVVGLMLLTVGLYLFLSNAEAVGTAVGGVSGALRWLLDPFSPGVPRKGGAAHNAPAAATNPPPTHFERAV